MDDSLFWGIPQGAYESAERMITLARKGGIRQHLLGDTSRIRHGSIEDQSVDDYCNFLQTKLCCEILQLEGEGVSGADGAAPGELPDELSATQADAAMAAAQTEQEVDTSAAHCCREEDKRGTNGWTTE